MGTPLNSITKRLFFSLGLLILNIVIIAFFAIMLLNHTTAISEVSKRLDEQHLIAMQIVKSDLDFLRFEPINSNYYASGTSEFLVKRYALLNTLIDNQNRLLEAMSDLDFLLDSRISSAVTYHQRYDSVFNLLIEKINERGFKDFALEGKMRTFAHQLEATALPLHDVLMLRRHEKDFMLRKEVDYIIKFNNLSNHILNKLPPTSGTFHLLTQYRACFNQLVALNYQIGISPSAGLMGKLNGESQRISSFYEDATKGAEEERSEILFNSAVTFTSISIVLIIISVMITFYTSMRISRPIAKLSVSMSKFIVNEGLDERDLEKSSENDEISMLSHSFIRLSRKLKKQFNEILHQNNELKKLNEELDRFIYSAAHDLKSPLASLDGLIDLARRDINSDRHDHYFRMMHGSVRKLEGFIRDITDYAKNKRQTLKIERIDLEALINDTIDGLRFLPEAHRIATSVVVNGGVMYTDKTRLEIVLKNMLANSFKYADMQKANPTIRIEATIEDRRMKLAVIDNGIGIGEEHLTKIFNMFYRAVEHSKGTGIGLFLVKESVKMLGGKISVKSKLGEWTAFKLQIPNLADGVSNIPESESVIVAEELA